MKLVVVCLAASIILVGCAGRQENVSVNSSSANTTTAPSPLVEATPSSSPTATATTTTTTPSPTANTERPVEFTYLGITPDKENMHYKIKVLTAKKITQVDLGVKFTDNSGKVLDETTLAWQNIVKSVKKPIEKGQTYDVLDYIPEGTTHADVVLKRVIFDDGTYWSAP
ncbi:MAG TPA: hypothetical protein VEV81_04475 [Pyrinomonadaceae bacterium]|nr:hypothetical protein [Pyrinomonadaceae bacterium]